MRSLLLAAFVTTLLACSHAKVKPTVVQPGCIMTPPPVTVAPVYAPCPDGLTICLDQPNAIVLRDDLRRMKDWINEAWLRCGPLTR